MDVFVELGATRVRRMLASRVIGPLSYRPI